MQEVTTASTASGGLNSFDQLRTSALVDASSSTRAFSDFMSLAGSQGYGTSSTSATSATSGYGISHYLEEAQVSAGAGSAAQSSDASGAAAQPLFASTAADKINAARTAATGQTTAQTAQAESQTSGQTNQAESSDESSSTQSKSKKTSESGSSASAATAQSLTLAQNTLVSRQSFEQAKPLLLKSGFTDKEMEDLSARVQAGILTWGQMVQSLATHTAGSTKSVQLSSSEKATLQGMFQKFGFDSQTAQGMTSAMADGEGLKVLSALQNKLQTMPDGTSVGLNQDELSTFFTALRAPSATAQALTQKLGGGNATAADMKTALSVLGQALTEQRSAQTAQDTATAKSLAKIMEQDVSKTARDTTGKTTATGSADPKVAYELKTKDKNDTSWFGDHEKNQQKQASDDAWKSFVAKVRQDDSGAQQSSAASSSGQTTATLAAAGAAAKGGADASSLGASASALTGMTQQSGTGSSQQAKAFDKVLAPKVLDQVSEAMLKDLGQGRKQLTMELDPDNLGKVQVLLQVKGKEVSAVIHAEDSGTAAMLSANMEGLRKSLEDKGLTVQHMDVQTGLASHQDQQQAAFNAEQHNQQAQEQQSMSRVLTQLRMVRSEGDVALDMQNKTVQAILADQGLHLIA